MFTENGRRVPFTYLVQCPLVPGYPNISSSHIEGIALLRAARVAVLLEREDLLFFQLRPQPAGRVTLVVHWTTATELPIAQTALKDSPGLRHIRADQLLSTAEYQRLRNVVDVAKEDAVYAECKALVLNIEASTRDTQRAAACNNTMAIIDRNRGFRREQEYRERDLQLREYEAREQGRANHLKEQEVETLRTMERNQRINDVLRALAPPKSTTTTCDSFLGGVRCKTTPF